MEYRISADVYSALMQKAKAHYTPQRGVLVRLRNKLAEIEIRLCAGVIQNKGRLMPSLGRLWRAEHVIHEGNLDGKAFKHYMEKYMCCNAEVVDTVMLETQTQGKLYCLWPCRGFKKCQTCKAAPLVAKQYEPISRRIRDLFRREHKKASTIMENKCISF